MNLVQHFKNVSECVNHLLDGFFAPMLVVRVVEFSLGRCESWMVHADDLSFKSNAELTDHRPGDSV